VLSSFLVSQLYDVILVCFACNAQNGVDAISSLLWNYEIVLGMGWGNRCMLKI
jgi:hypothetical protein